MDLIEFNKIKDSLKETMKSINYEQAEELKYIMFINYPKQLFEYNSEYDRMYTDIYTIEEFKEMVNNEVIIDDDGTGYLMKDNMMNRGYDAFSYDKHPEATHVAWFNK